MFHLKTWLYKSTYGYQNDFFNTSFWFKENQNLTVLLKRKFQKPNKKTTFKSQKLVKYDKKTKISKEIPENGGKDGNFFDEISTHSAQVGSRNETENRVVLASWSTFRQLCRLLEAEFVGWVSPRFTVNLFWRRISSY